MIFAPDENLIKTFFFSLSLFDRLTAIQKKRENKNFTWKVLNLPERIDTRNLLAQVLWHE